MQYSPRFVGLAARPRAATPPHSQSSKLCKMAELAALPRGCSEAPCSMTPYLRTPHERAVSPCLAGARLAARGRPAAPDGQAPFGCPRRVSNIRPIVLAGCELLNTRHDTAPRRHDLRQSGGGNPITLAGRCAIQAPGVVLTDLLRLVCGNTSQRIHDDATARALTRRSADALARQAKQGCADHPA
jgi:hypothetical protein